MGRLRMTVTGDKELIRKLKHLAERGAKRAARKAVNAGTQPILKAVRAKAPVETGALKKALVKKTTGRDFRYNGIVGADVDYVGEDGRKPGNYDHLVEYGYQHDGGTTVPPHSFIRAGYDQSIGEAQAKYEAKLAAEIEREAMKGA